MNVSTAASAATLVLKTPVMSFAVRSSLAIEYPQPFPSARAPDAGRPACVARRRVFSALTFRQPPCRLSRARNRLVMEPIYGDARAFKRRPRPYQSGTSAGARVLFGVRRSAPPQRPGPDGDAGIM